MGRKQLGRRSVVLLIALCSCQYGRAQNSQPAEETVSQPTAPYTLRVTTREVLVDVIAVDEHNRPVRDLAPADLTVLDLEHAGPTLQSISSFRIVEPNAAWSDDGESQVGFRLGRRETCLVRSSIHYELGYHPGLQGEKSGYHTVFIRTTRDNVRLFYLRRFYVGMTAESPRRNSDDAAGWQKELNADACSHLAVPPSIGLKAIQIPAGASDAVKYSVQIDADALGFISFSSNGRRVQLDYGACDFNSAGKRINYFTATSDLVLTPDEFANVQAHGFLRVLEFPRPDGLAMTRFVVRDRATGNLGLADVHFPSEEQVGPDPNLHSKLNEVLQQAEARAAFPIPQMYGPPPLGPIGSFGSVVPASDSFCADVYELSPNISKLPDFRTLDPIGSIYTNFLGVPNQLFTATQGIPGVTDRTEWFGMDYHATFWISKAGTYDFMMLSDDGAILMIDDEQVIDLDGLHPALSDRGRTVLATGMHSIHVPYYEGPGNVALVLWVRPYGGKWKIFDLRDFAAPAGSAH